MLDTHDNLALERVLGLSDIFPIHYLEKGLQVAKSICRIVIKDDSGRSIGYGTGFLVAPTLLLTNNHVFPNTETALRSSAQFNYELDLQFNARVVQEFRFQPNELFITNQDLDFTLVAVQPISISGARIQEFGYLPLIKQTGKALLGEYVSIIQHPKGDYKAVVIRENKITDMLDHFIHYSADTEPGSSGSTVFNDQWQVIALHHSGVPDPNHDGQFIANEGVRISSILNDIEQKKPTLSTKQQTLLQGLGEEIAFATQPIDNDESVVAEDFDIERFEAMTGYDPQFLGERNTIAHPTLRSDLKADVAELNNGNGSILNYTHFSIVMSKSRRLAFYTVVNIDGKQLKDVGRSDNWRYDPRIDRKYQVGNELYQQNPFDRGHLVRRRDPIWGPDAATANDDTFHFTNCSPQHERFNQNPELWLGLEDYILHHTDNNKMKATVFNGPVFRENDIVYRGIKIPEEYWKVAVMVKDNGETSATAYLVSQKELIRNLEAEPFGAFRTFQVKVSLIESMTGLNFGELSKFDPLERTEATTLGHLLERVEDIQL
ncbi:DNA/RNA non-specific endonuclease [Paenibacillus curdlanolyticus YK9]|uniref:Serine protease n=2 Tax=Paenibacillus curdlanolyticus TaxID=59840 RepID=E0I9F9_9BACL|nr:DNA/RNA non-specific endonuclease [Paenibacillus curdlanolyticus YK9]